ncbi:hypothetical protein Tco_0475018 [Tanacetum coccineum]
MIQQLTIRNSKTTTVSSSSSQPNTNRATSPIHPVGDENTVRIIPDPVGILQATKLRKTTEIREGGNKCVMPTHEYVRKVIEYTSKDDHFTRDPWLSAVQYLNAEGGIASGCFGDMKTFCMNEKLEKVVAVIKSCTPNALSELTVSLKDPSRTISENAPSMFSIRIHHDGIFQKYPGKRYVDGHEDIFDTVNIDLFTVIALNKIVLQLGPLTPTSTRIMESIKKEAHLMKELTGIPCGKNAKTRGSASMQTQQADYVVGQDGSGGLGVGVFIGLSAAGGQPGHTGVGVGSQSSSSTRWTK